MAYPDFKPAQPEALRRLNQKYSRKESNIGNKVAERMKTLQKIRENAWELFTGFGEKTTIHGMGRLCNRKANNCERIFWLITISLALGGTIYVCIVLSERFQAGNLQSIVDDTGAPVYKIAFPAVTICNVNRLNWDRLQEAKERFMPGETNNETLAVFEKVIGLYDLIEFARFDIFNALEKEPIHLVQNVNFSLVFEFMTWNCDELLTRCVWRHREMDCCEIFLRRRSKMGICWSFNTLETDEGRRRHEADPKYPWRTGSAGPKSALKARVLLNTDKHFSSTVEKGITLMIAEPAVWHRDPFFIPENTDTTIGIDPTIYFYDEDTRSLTSAQRECVFNDEHKSHDVKLLQGFVYMLENCEAECHQEYLEQYCNCSVDLLFPPGQHKACGVTDLLCLARNNDYFRYTHQYGADEYVSHTAKGMLCKCYNNCYSLQYMTYVRPTFLPSDVRGNTSYVNLDIHFRSETMMVYCTNLVFSWIDLMVAFGGIAGLFLGCSLVSAVEVIYFTCVEVPVFAFKELQLKRNIQKNQQYIQNIQPANTYQYPPEYSRDQGKRLSRNRISIVENINKNYYNSYYLNKHQQQY